MKDDKNINDEVQRALATVLPIIYSSMAVTAESDLKPLERDMVYSYDHFPGKINKNFFENLSHIEKQAVKVLSHYRAAVTRLDESLFLRRDRHWQERVLSKEPFKGYVVRWLDFVLPKLDRDIQDQFLFENSFRPRLIIEVERTTPLSFTVKINKEILSLSQLQKKLDFYQQQKTPVVIHLVDKPFIGPPSVSKLDEKTLLGEISEITSSMDTFHSITGELLECVRADTSMRSLIQLKRTLGNRAFRRTLKEGLARNALIDEFSRFSGQFSRVANRISFLNEVYDSYLENPSYAQIFSTGTTVLARNYFDDFASGVAKGALIRMGLPPPVAAILLVFGPSASDFFPDFKLEKSKLPYVKSQSLTPQLINFYFAHIFEQARLFSHESQHASIVPIQSSEFKVERKVDSPFHRKFELISFEDLFKRRVEENFRQLLIQPRSPDVNPQLLLKTPRIYIPTGDSHRNYLAQLHADPTKLEIDRGWHFWVSGRQLGLTFSMGQNFDGNVSIDWLGFIIFAYRNIKYWLMSPAEKAGVELLRSAGECCNKPSQKNKLVLNEAINQFTEKNPDKIGLSKLMLFSVETESWQNLLSLIKNDRYGCLQVKKDYQEHFSRLTEGLSNGLGVNSYDADELLRVFPLEPITHFINAQNCTWNQEFSRGLNSIDTAINLLAVNYHGKLTDPEYLRCRNDCENEKHHLLLGLVKQNPEQLGQLQNFHKIRQERSPNNLLLLRQERSAYIELKRNDLALAVADKIDKLNDMEIYDTYQRGLLLHKNTKHEEAVTAFQSVLNQIEDKEAPLAYLSRLEIRNIFEQQNLLPEALSMAEMICQHACSVEDYKKLGDFHFKFNENQLNQAGVKAYEIYLQNSRSPDKGIILQVAKYYSPNEPGKAWYYLNQGLKTHPHHKEMIKLCEKICIQHQQFLLLKNFYQKINNPDCAERLAAIEQLLLNQARLNRLEGVIGLFQLGLPLLMRSAQWNHLSKNIQVAISGVDTSLSILQKWAPAYCRASIKPNWVLELEDKTSGWSISNTAGLFSKVFSSMSAILHFAHFYKSAYEPEFKRDSMRWWSNVGFEGAALFADSMQTLTTSLPEIKQLSDLAILAQASYQSLSHPAELLTQIFDGSKQLYDSAFNLGKNITETIKESGMVTALERYGDYALGFATSLSWGMRLYEFKLRSCGEQLPESREYYMLRNMMLYTPVTVAVASKLGVVSAGAAAVKSGAAGATWVASSVATGGSQAALGLAAGASGVGLLAVGVYGVYKGVQWIDGVTTVQNQLDAISHNYNFQQLAKEQKYPALIEGLQKIDKINGDAKNETRISYYQCCQHLRAGEYQTAKQLATHMLQNNSLENDMALALRRLRLDACRGLSATKKVEAAVPWSDFRAIIPTDNPEEAKVTRQVMMNILSNHFNQWQKVSKKDYAEGINILKEMATIQPDNNIKQQIDILDSIVCLEKKDYEKFDILQNTMQARGLTDLENANNVAKVRFNAALQLATDGQSFEKYTPMQHYQQLIKTTKDDKEKQDLTDGALFILDCSAAQAAKKDDLMTAINHYQSMNDLRSSEIIQQKIQVFQLGQYGKEQKFDDFKRVHQQILEKGFVHEELHKSHDLILIDTIFELAKQEKPFSDYNPWQTYQGLLPGIKDEKQIDNLNKKMLFILESDARQAEKRGDYVQAMSNSEKMFNIKPDIIYQHRKEFYQEAQLLEQKNYSDVYQHVGKILLNRQEMDEGLVANFLTLKLSATAQSVNESKEAKVENIDQNWQDFMEWSTINTKLKQVDQLQNPEKSAAEEPQKEIIIFLLHKALNQSARQGHLEAGIINCDRILSLTPQASEIVEQRRHFEYQLDLKNANYLQLLEKCQLKLAETPNDTAALRFSAFAYLQQQKWENSTQYFQQLAAAKPQDVEAVLYLAQIARMKQNYVSAKHFANIAINRANEAVKKRQLENSEDKQEQELLVQQSNQAKECYKIIEADIASIWHSAMGQSAGRVAAHAMTEMIHFGMSMWQSRNLRQRRLNLQLPVLGKSGSDSMMPISSPEYLSYRKF